MRPRSLVMCALIGIGVLGSSSPAAADSANSYLRVLTVFQSLQQGMQPMSAVSAGADGTLFGTTGLGGSPNCALGKYACGTVFSARKSGSSWTLTTAYAFHGGSDGADPLASVIIDSSGDLFGTTVSGGTGCSGGCGTVFKLIPSGSGYRERVLYRFKGGSDGSGPTGALVADKNGALYGLTVRGGTGTGCTSGPTYGCGTVYKLTPSGSGYAETVIHSFQGSRYDGALPGETALALDARGDLFGTTNEGGYLKCEDGCGIAFELTLGRSGYAEHILHFFTGAPDGARPYGGVIFDTDGNLYGTTEIGGDVNACPAFGGCGTVFRLTTSSSAASESVVYAFVAGADAYAPLQALVADSSGALYGASPAGGFAQIGVLFKLTPTGNGFVETVLHDFHAAADGYGPYGSLIVGPTGVLYGTAISGPYGGGGGEVFEFNQ